MVKHTATCTPAQHDAVGDAARKAGLNQAQFIRMAVANACAAFGVGYPDDLTERGKYDRSKIDWVKRYGNDKGDYDDWHKT